MVILDHKHCFKPNLYFYVIYANMQYSGLYNNQNVDLKLLEESKNEYREMLKLSIPTSNYCYNWWRSQKIPIHFDRYEDLILETVLNIILLISIYSR